MSEEKNNKTEQSDTTSKDISEIELHTIFTYQEIESLVKSFVLAYIRGYIKIDFRIFKVDTNDIDNKATMAAKNMLREHIEICSGVKDVTSDELRKTVYELFGFILRFRNGRRIEGEFTPIELEQKIDEMAKKYDFTDKLVMKIYSVLIDEANADGRM